MSIGLVALSVATTAVGIYASNEAATAQQRAINAQFAAQTEEMRQQTSGEIFERDREARREQARIRVAAGESGLNLGAGSVETMLMDSAFQAGLARDRNLANLESRTKSSEAQANSELSRIERTGVLGAGLQLASAGLSAYAGSPAGKATISRGAQKG